jgi:hypothetical protein
VLSVGKGPERSGIVRLLTEGEREALLTACQASPDPNIYCAIVLALTVRAPGTYAC